MKPRYDAVVVGAGPAGSVAAGTLACGGAAVLLLDRREVVGEPVRCGELIRRDSLLPFAEAEGPWVLQAFDEYHVVAPDGFRIRFREPGLGILLDRRVFDKELARRAVAAGAELWTSSQVVGVSRPNGAVTGVIVEDPGGERRAVEAPLVIAADGVASRIARLAGIDTSLGLGEMAATISCIVEHQSWADRECELHFGQAAPGGYLWVFPRRPGAANVGAGVSARLSRGRSALALLREFVARRFPEGRLTRVVAGGIPIARPAKRFCWPGLFLAGDAARQVNPLTGAGIFTSMSAGALAGAAGLRLIGGGSLDEARDLYEGGWRQRFGPFTERSLTARRQLDRVSDADLDAAARALGEQRLHRSVAQSIMELAATAEALSRGRDVGPPLSAAVF